MKPIFLIGFPAVGKTTIGKKVAELLNLRFIDTDGYLQFKYHNTISDMISTCGIDKFRKREKVILLELALVQDAVIATGGGLACHDDNMQTMKARGTVVYLRASEEALTERLYQYRDERPAVEGLDKEGVRQYVQETLQQRLPYYEQADITVDAETVTTDADIERVAAEIARLIPREA
ncbi:MAG: shikimate kinase [Porphyromonas sp.]|nr:shikimate kinase [Porphyromonas sp.]